MTHPEKGHIFSSRSLHSLPILDVVNNLAKEMNVPDQPPETNKSDEFMVLSIEKHFPQVNFEDEGRKVDDFSLEEIMSMLVRHNNHGNDDEEGSKKRLQWQANFYHSIIRLFYRMENMVDKAADDDDTTFTTAAPLQKTQK
eukprot:CAMPEP_0172489884 /NCGR_PEP_ID=MMETSP1066-20121228/20155_1 /TAXON_ID=671091 /ORGANISM="Coscinodiscus wailesii, Strain CCMP2513" /LENGTH=140 /DNA_ID=CAMNT_0013258071 /DNA_START=728 /DNA_END=1150 /DNA_ORIENTATION=+